MEDGEGQLENEMIGKELFFGVTPYLNYTYPCTCIHSRIAKAFNFLHMYSSYSIMLLLCLYRERERERGDDVCEKGVGQVEIFD